MKQPTLAIVVPCYNEEAVLDSTINRLIDVLDDLVKNELISEKSFLFFVDDGSVDKTFQIISWFHDKYPDKVKAISFVKNFGNQKALLAGLLEVRQFDFDCCITIDADLQQDENKIAEFIEKYSVGNEMVYGIKIQRNDTSIFKKICAESFYKIMNLMGVKTTPNHSEYRLVSRNIINVLAEYSEHNLFLRGVFQDIGNNPAFVYYDVKKRQAGESKFSLFDLFSLAIQGITSFSTRPLRLVTYLGMVISCAAFILGISVIIEKLLHLSLIDVPGWATIVVALSFFGGIQIFCIGIIGEYIGQIFMEVKSRPRYVVGKKLN